MSNLYEILELPDGDIALRRVDGDNEPLMQIHFSEQARAYMLDENIEVAKAMVEAGIKALSRISEHRGNGSLQSTMEEEKEELSTRVLH